MNTVIAAINILFPIAKTVLNSFSIIQSAEEGIDNDNFIHSILIIRPNKPPYIIFLE